MIVFNAEFISNESSKKEKKAIAVNTKISIFIKVNSYILLSPAKLTLSIALILCPLVTMM